MFFQGPGSVSGGGASPGGAEGEPDHECGDTTPWLIQSSFAQTWQKEIRYEQSTVFAQSIKMGQFICRGNIVSV